MTDIRSTGVIDLAPLAQRTTTGQGAAIQADNLSDYGKVLLMVESVSGAGRTLDVSIEDSVDGVAGWAATGYAFPQFGVTGGVQALDVYVDQFRQYIRLSWVIAGTTPVFRFGCALLAR